MSSMVVLAPHPEQDSQFPGSLSPFPWPVSTPLPFCWHTLKGTPGPASALGTEMQEGALFPLCSEEDSGEELTQMQSRDGSVRKVCQGSEGGRKSDGGHAEMSSLGNPHLWQRGLRSGPWPEPELSSGNTSRMAWPGPHRIPHCPPILSWE